MINIPHSLLSLSRTRPISSTHRCKIVRRSIKSSGFFPYKITRDNRLFNIRLLVPYPLVIISVFVLS